MPHSAASTFVPGQQTFPVAEDFTAWLSPDIPQGSSPCLRAWRVVTASRVINYMLRHAARLPALAALYLAPQNLATRQQAQPEVSHSGRRQVFTLPVQGPAHGSISVADATTITTTGRCSASESVLGNSVVAVSPDDEWQPVYPSDGTVAVVDCGARPSSGLGGDGGEMVPSQGEDLADDGAPRVWPLLNVLHGDLCDVHKVCLVRQGRIRLLRIRLPSFALQEEVTKKAFMEVVLACDPEILQVEVDENECMVVLSVLDEIKDTMCCQQLTMFLFSPSSSAGITQSKSDAVEAIFSLTLQSMTVSLRTC
ncbi:hypothetical protein L226DRAFT_576673 [Lentinus tigrinus ALCF2SS1-7]|uniref:uncharacterized protein n=1 Tax=Lentinus tigrinus ALCF2SS1-7 TaxID=1328758 RepID=UPI001165D05B|nr:hypothetical protein L226DRAFT_576673 [Lentinus tigrinus ALCF2SS1-7]